MTGAGTKKKRVPGLTRLETLWLVLRSPVWKLIQRVHVPVSQASSSILPRTALWGTPLMLSPPPTGKARSAAFQVPIQRTRGQCPAQILTCAWWAHETNFCGVPQPLKQDRDKEEKTAAKDKHRARGVGKKHSDNHKDQNVLCQLKPETARIKYTGLLTEGPSEHRAGGFTPIKPESMTASLLMNPELPPGPGEPRDQAC